MQKLSPNSQVMPLSRDRMESFEKKMKEASKMYEKLFLRDMVKAMRKTVPEGGLFKKNMANKIFSEKLDAQYVENWGDQGGIGLSELIYNQVMERFGPMLGKRGPMPLHPSGPVQFKESTAIPIKTGSKSLQFELKPKGDFHQPLQKSDSNQLNLKNDLRQRPSMQLEEPSTQTNQLQSPWKGTVEKIVSLENQSNVIEIHHDNGLQSMIHFKGPLKRSDLLGKEFQAGEGLPGASFIGPVQWKINLTS